MDRIQLDGTLVMRDDCIGEDTSRKRQTAMAKGVGGRATNGHDDRRGGAEMTVCLFY